MPHHASTIIKTESENSEVLLAKVEETTKQQKLNIDSKL